MYDDDIDWTYASWDWGLVKLCREMDKLANPLVALEVTARRRPKASSRAARRDGAPISGVAEAA